MNVIIVDDEPLVQRTLSRMFAERGHDVICRATGHEALSAARSVEAEALVLDWQLPDMTGLDVTRRLRRASDQRVIVIISGRHGRDELKVAFDAGADDFLVKPLTRDLVMVVEHRLRRLSPAGGRRVGDVSVRVAPDGAWITSGGSERRVLLSLTELAILDLLVEASGVVSRATLIERVWPNTPVTDHIIDTNISRMRHKLTGTGLRIELARGVGFRLGATGGGGNSGMMLNTSDDRSGGAVRHTITRAWSPWWRATMAAALVGCGGQATVEEGPALTGGSNGSGGSGGVGAAGGGGSASLTYCEWLDDGNFNVLLAPECKSCVDETYADPSACGNAFENPLFYGSECDEATDADAQEALAIQSCTYCDVCGSVCPGFSPHCE